MSCVLWPLRTSRDSTDPLRRQRTVSVSGCRRSGDGALVSGFRRPGERRCGSPGLVVGVGRGTRRATAARAGTGRCVTVRAVPATKGSQPATGNKRLSWWEPRSPHHAQVEGAGMPDPRSKRQRNAVQDERPLDGTTGQCAGQWRMRTPAGANDTRWAVGTMSTPQWQQGSGRPPGAIGRPLSMGGNGHGRDRPASRRAKHSGRGRHLESALFSYSPRPGRPGRWRNGCLEGFHCVSSPEARR
jgi:hypothetical protein